MTLVPGTLFSLREATSFIQGQICSGDLWFSARICRVAVLCFMLGTPMALPTYAQALKVSSTPEEFRPCLEQKPNEKYNSPQEAEAIVKSCRALIKAEEATRPGVSVEYLAMLQVITAVAEENAGNLDAADALYRNALDNIPSTEQLTIAHRLNHLGLLYYRQGKYAKAEELYLRSLEVRQKALGSNHPDVATSLSNLANLYHEQGLYVKAEPLFQQALAIREMTLGSDSQDVARSLADLAELYRTQGLYSKAEPLLQRALTIREKVLGLDSPEVASTLNALAMLFQEKGQYPIAESLYQQSLAIDRKAGRADSLDFATTLNNLADLYRLQGQYEKAELLYRNSLEITEKIVGPKDKNVATSLNNLAEIYRVQGQYSKAEPLYHRSLKVYEEALGPDHPSIAIPLNNLALLFAAQRRYENVEALNLRALAISEKVFGKKHPSVATSLLNLAQTYREQKQYGKAELYFIRSLEMMIQTVGPEHPNVASSLNGLGLSYWEQGQTAKAEPLYQRALAISEKALGPEHPNVATTLQNLALLSRYQGNYAEADLSYKRSLAIRELVLGLDHPDVALTLNNYAELKAATGDDKGALGLVRRADVIYRQRLISGNEGSFTTETMTSLRETFGMHLALLAKQGDSATIAESFDLAQLRGSSMTGQAVGQMAARFANGSNAIAKSVRHRQDLAHQLKELNDTLVKELSKVTGKRNGELIEDLRSQTEVLKKELSALDVEIAKRFPEYAELTRPEPLSVGETQKLLKDDEALLVYALANRQGWVWIIRKNAADWRTLDTNKAEIEKLVASVRGRMNDDCGDLPCPAELGALHTLYTKLVAPIAGELKELRHLLLVPDGGLQGLPFSMLVASPAQHGTDPLKTDYTQIDWLARHHSVTVLPAVQSLRALRLFARSEVGQDPFIGFGDPVLEGSESQGTARGKRIERKVALRGGLADTAEIRQLEPLPATATELKEIAKTLKAKPDMIWLRERATEDNVKTLDLSRYRTVAFATHGQLAGSVKGSYEPGLIFTPPTKGSEQNDGYLTASEAAQLKLRAEWVLLSACNTAAADGTPGAEGLSGLAKAFFYAGGKTLLVSHWPVDSDATVKLTTTMMRLHQDEPKMTKAEAHRQSMLTLMTDRQNPEYAHPFYWAPFAIVGEGGR
jgi:CHAT domain-containing protein/Tfp pilus assembly protein PilF